MSQSAALYTVAVRERSRGGASLPLGDLDGTGTSLQQALVELLDAFAFSSEDGARAVQAISLAVDGDDLFALLRHGQSGIAADIVDAAGRVRLRQRPDDMQFVRHGCLFRLPPASDRGLLAVHVANGRGLKELFERGLGRRFRERLPGLALEIEHLPRGDLLREAVAANRLAKLRLSRVERPGSHAVPSIGTWVGADETARVEVEIAASAGAGRIRPALIERYLSGDSSAFEEIARLAGIPFDEAKVEVVLPDDTRRLVDIAHPKVSRPLSVGLPGVELDLDGEPTVTSLRAELGRVLTAHGAGVARQELDPR